jgi:hypothetical protein
MGNLKEGLYGEEDGKAIEASDRDVDQEEINRLIDKVFEGKCKKLINFEEYQAFNMNVSSEMFVSIMSLLHERLPCAPNCFRLKKIFRK